MRRNMHNCFKTALTAGVMTVLLGCSTRQATPNKINLFVADPGNVMVDVIRVNAGDQVGKFTAPEAGYYFTSNAINRLQREKIMP